MTAEFILTRPFSYEIKANGDLEVFGDISNTGLDLVNDIVSKACLESMRDQIKSRNIKLDIEHESFRGRNNEEQEINKTKIPAGRMVDPLVVKSEEGFALQVRGLINSFMSRFKEVKGSIENKFLDAFSIAFIPTKIRMVKKGNQTIRILEDVNLLNVALTGNPVNTTAQMREIIAKSIDAVEEYKRQKIENPELEDQLEVKSEPTSTGNITININDKNRASVARTARNEAIAGGDDDEDEEETKPKKKEKKYGHGKKPKVKAYEKDGGHSHEGADPIGEHNHPEIEMALQNSIQFIHERIDNIMENQSEESVMATKDKEIKSCVTKYNMEVKKMTQDEQVESTETTESTEESEATEKPAEETTEEKPAEAEAEAEAPAESNETVSEIKALKDRIAKLEEDKEISETKAADRTANSKAVASNQDVNNVQAEKKALGGLNEIQ